MGSSVEAPSEASQKVLCKQYLRRDGEHSVCEHCGQSHESLDELFDRVSFGNAEYREMLSSFDFLPGSPAIFNAGGSGTLSACFKFDVQDTMESILDVASKSALVQKWGGGVGYCLSELRQKGAPIRSTHGKACGPVAVMWMYQSVAEMITQGGKRESAQMAILHCEHSDIEEFVHCKETEGVLDTFNISVAVTDDFMRRVKGSGERHLFDEIVRHAWRNGDPGLYFIDTAERANPTPELGKLTGTNPCIAEHHLVLTRRGWIPIKDVSLTDEVLGHDELFHRVLAVLPQGVRETVDVVLRTGRIVRCTSDHPFFVDGEKVEAQSLKKVEPLHSPVAFEVTKDSNYVRGYLDGKVYGDGTIGDRIGFCGPKEADVVEVAQLLNTRFGCNVTARPDQEGVSGSTIWRTTTGQSDAVRYYQDFDLRNVKNMSLSYQAGFLNGWFNTDGHYENNNGMECINLTIGERNTVGIKEIWYILQNFGIPPKIYYVERVGHASDGKYSIRSSNSFRVQVSGRYYDVLADIIGWSHKESKSYDILPLIDVLEIRPSDKHTVYDLTVEGSHSFVVEGIKVSNCGEVPLLDNESCNLGSINLANFVTPDSRHAGYGILGFERLEEVARLATRYLDQVIDSNFYPVPEVKEATLKTRKIGLGVMGWADALALMRVPYDSQEAVDLAGEVMKHIQEAARGESKVLAKELESYGHEDMRNDCLTCIAPTGSISTIANCSSGIEPHYSLEYIQVMGDGTKLSRVLDFGDFVPKTANEIGWEWHIKHQAAFQKYVDLAVSKTINMPNSATEEDVAGAYVAAWESECKGITVYREGSRQKQAMYKGDIETYPADVVVGRERRKLARDRMSLTHKFDVGEMEGYLHIGLFPDGTPGELFVTGSKQGSTISGLLDGVAILTSLALQYGVPLEAMVSKLQGTRFEPSGLTGNSNIPTASSLLDYIFRYFQLRCGNKVTEGLEGSGMVCPDCEAPITFQEGCLYCSAKCGWSRC